MESDHYAHYASFHDPSHEKYSYFPSFTTIIFMKNRWNTALVYVAIISCIFETGMFISPCSCREMRKNTRPCDFSEDQVQSGILILK